MINNDTANEIATKTILRFSISMPFCIMIVANPKLTKNETKYPKIIFRGCANVFSGAANSKIAVAANGGKIKEIEKLEPKNPITRKQINMLIQDIIARRI